MTKSRIRNGLALALLLGLWLGLTACGDSASSTATAIPTDPTRNLSPREVVDTYIADYRKGDYAHAHWLFSAAVRASNTVDDETRSAQQAIAESGPITGATVVVFQPQYADYIALIRFEHRDPNGFEQYSLRLRHEDGAWKITTRAPA